MLVHRIPIGQIDSKSLVFQLVLNQFELKAQRCVRSPFFIHKLDIIMNQLVIGIPGPWKDQSDVIRAVVKANSSPESPQFVAMGGLIMDMRTKASFGFQVYEHDASLIQAFECAGQGRFTDDELNVIGGHRHTVYLVCGEPFASPPRESLDAARSLLALGAFMLDAGGFAVKVEHSGIAHTADRWRYYAKQGTILSLYDAFVTMVGDSDFNFTCGMHTFGLPDVSLTTDIPIENAPFIMNGFNQYQLLESPELSDEAIFARSHCDPLLTMSHRAYGYDEDDLLNNPFGRWHLELSNEAPSENTTKFQAGSEPLFMAIRQNDPELLTSVEQARASLRWFIHHFRSPYEYGHYQVKARICDGDESAYFWTILVDVSDEGLTVELFEVPPEFANHRVGQQLLLRNHDVYDWCINRNGTLIGGFSRRLQRERTPPEERHQYDLYSGEIAFAPIDEIPRTRS